MKKFRFLFIFLLLAGYNIQSQTIVGSVNLPTGTFWSSGYGLVYASGNYWISSASSTSGQGKLFAVDSTGALVDSVVVVNYPALRESQGLTYDGTNFWYVERKTARCDLFKISREGVILDSIPIASAGGTTSWYLGGAAWDGTGLWVSLYYPDAKAGIYKIDVTAKTIIDSIPSLGLQPTGVTIKGDTLFYANDGFQGVDKLYAVSLSTKDTLFSFNVPEQPGLRQNPRGLAWDGKTFWLMAEPIGASSGRMLFKYDLGGSGTAGINVLTKNIDFDNVQVDSTRFTYIYINNYGTAQLVIDSVYINNSVFQFEQSLPIQIKPDSTAALKISFTPTHISPYVDSILFFHNDPNFIYSKTNLKGNGISTLPYMSLSFNQFNYGNKRVNSTTYQLLTIENKGSGQLEIDSVILSTENYFTEMIGFNATIDSVKMSSFRIWFNPDKYSMFKDTLKIYSNAVNGTVTPVTIVGMGTPFDSTLGNKVWEGEIPDNPSVSNYDKSAKFVKRISDISGDGIGDLIVAAENYLTVAYNGNSSGNDDVLWTFASSPNNNNTGSVMRQQGIQVISDINGDGYSDVIIGTGGGNEFVYALDGISGKKIWEFGDSINYGNGDINGLDVKRDFTGDGIPDILVSASGNEFNGEGRFSVYLLNGSTGEQIWRIDQSAQKKLKDAITSTDFGGAVGSKTSGGTAGEITGFDRQGNIVWTHPTQRSVWGLTEINDINGNGNKDIIAGDVGGYVYAVTADSGKLIWNSYLGNVFIEDIYSVPDLNDSGVDDILISAITPTVFILEGSTGNLIWSSGTGGNILGAAVLGDLNADGHPEIGTASLNNQLHVFESKTGLPIFNITIGSGNDYVPEIIWEMDDVDKNGSLEFFVGTRDGKVMAFSGGTDVIVGLQHNNNFIPEEFSLSQNYPNPFNPSTVIQYQIPFEQKVTLKVYDILGREIAELVNSVQKPGNYKYTWNGIANSGVMISSGVYLYKLETEKFTATKKMLMLK
ncbi:MAG: choice-of-anchor D domain-containing protein [Ignavibacteria bacterium]|nr:choice-of-anchor D domain-containing protein [Ignavibacteria bacterium]